MKLTFFFLAFALLVECGFSQNNPVPLSAVDSIVIKQVDSLIQLSRAFTGKREFDKALEVNAIAESLTLEKFDTLSALYGTICFNHGRVFYFKSDNQGAEYWYLKSKSIREKVLGKEHPDYAAILHYLATLYWKMGKYEKSEPLYLESKAIREKVLGKEHPDYGASLNNLANLYWKMGKYEKSEPLYLESKAIREKVLGKEHPDYGASLNNLANLYRDMGNYEKSELLYLEAVAIKEKLLGKEHLDYAVSLNNLAILYRNMGNYEKAESLYLEVVAIREKVLGKENADFASCLNNLANLYRDMGNYEKSEPLYLEAVAILEKVLGKEHPDYGASLNNLANLYRDMGNYENAEPLYLKVVAILEKVLGKENPNYATSLNNLAALYLDKVNYEKAELLYLEAVAIREKVLGKEHPDYALSLNNLAILYRNLGNYEKSELLHVEALAILEKVLGKEHVDYATSLNNLAILYREMGNYEKAEPLYLAAEAIREKVLGKEHPDYAASLHNLANLYSEMGNYEKAEPLYEDAINWKRKNISSALHHLSEKEMQQYLLTFQTDVEGISSATQHMTQASGMAQLCYDNALFFKGFLLHASNFSKHLFFSDTLATAKYQLLKSYSRRLAAEYSKPIAVRKGIAELEEKSNTIEKDLAKTVAGYKESMKQVNWQEVKQKLKANEAAIEFVRYHFSDKKSTDPSRASGQSSVMYSAMLIRSDKPQPLFIPLFEEKSLDSLFNISYDRKLDFVNGLYTIADKVAIDMNKPKRNIYEVIWKPLEKELNGIKTIYFSPSGQLHRINLDAIPISANEKLADRYEMIALNSTRQLVIPHEVKIVNNAAILYGGVRYEQDTTIQMSAQESVASRSEAFSFRNIDSSLRGGNFKYLAGTEQEVNSINKIMMTTGIHTEVRKGYEADEESFKAIGNNNLPSPRILHIATHGYFFKDPKESHQSSVINRQEESVFKMSDHPMLRSGLILAGGNATWQGKQKIEGKEDGILTAYEISQMNLSNTELVVLSACETGLGEIQGNEGVYGLQRAFKIAGAKYLIMSLWQVRDKETSLLMTTFYKKWLKEKMTIANAFRSAQKQLRDSGLGPYFWAGFVLIE